MILAQTTADSKKKKVEVVWRGHREIVQPGGVKFSIDHLRGRVIFALGEMVRTKHNFKLSKEEQAAYDELLKNYAQEEHSYISDSENSPSIIRKQVI